MVQNGGIPTVIATARSKKTAAKPSKPGKTAAPTPNELKETFGEIYKDQRPTLWKDMIGQKHVTSVLQKQLKAKKVAHTILFSGPSGVGKTTMARILSAKLNGGVASSHDIKELNCAGESRGIDTVRDMAKNFKKRPFRPGGVKVFILDEAHKLSTDAQDALLKLLEDTPSWVYVILCSTHPDKISATLRTRASVYKCEAGTIPELVELIKRESRRYEIPLTSEETASIASSASGSHRKALVILNSIRYITDRKERAKLIEKADESAVAVNLARALLESSGWGSWDKIAGILKQLKGAEDPESIRWTVLGYMTSVALGQKAKSARLARCVWVLQSFSESVRDCGFSGLVTASVTALSNP